MSVKYLFKMDLGVLGSEEEEIMEYDKELSDEDLDQEVKEWFWDNFNGGYEAVKIEEK